MKVSVVGCSLGDYLFTGIDFASANFSRYSSKTPGDGGIVPGQLVFGEALSKFAGEPLQKILQDVAGTAEPDKFNLGGPAIVACINASQLAGDDCQYSFYGRIGNDDTGRRMMEIISSTSVDTANYISGEGMSPFTWVLSDPSYHNGKGERSFINTIGIAGEYCELPESFYEADVHFYGATALTPGIHDRLSTFLKKSRELGKITMVSTVFDFRNEFRDPAGRWPMGDGDESYKYIDLLAIDWDEAVRLSGLEEINAIIDFFFGKGVGAVVITHGAKDFYAASAGTLFKPFALHALPVAACIDEYLAEDPSRRGDTTGCGDNFAGGLLAGMIKELQAGKVKGELSLLEACTWAGVSGGFACTTVGGTYIEKSRGEKLTATAGFAVEYRKQLTPYFQ